MHQLNGPTGQTALVTGASRGIGRATALLLASQGVTIGVNFRAGKMDALQVVRAIEARGGRAVALGGDVSQADQAKQLVERAEDVLGPLDILINNAGITRDRLVVQMSSEDWAATWETNLVGARSVARAALSRMVERGSGRIVNLSSVVGSTGNSGQANYAAAKSALLGLTRRLAVEAAPRGVTVNCVLPGYIATDATARLTAEQRDGWMRRIPMGRTASPHEVAEAIAFLVGPSAAYITGQCLAVDGGLLAAARV